MDISDDKIDQFIAQAKRMGLEDPEKIQGYVDSAIEREARLKDRAAKLAAEKAQAELEKLKIEAERQAEKLKIEAERQAELEKFKIEKEFELKRLELQNQPTANVSSSSGQSFGPKNIPRLPMFQESVDEIDSFIFRFEAHAVLCKWDKEQWPIHFASCLQGSALTFFHSLCAAGPVSYDDLKQHFLTKFQCSSSAFRERFRQAKPEPGESFPAYLTRLRHYFDRWVTLSGIVKNFDGLVDLLLREQLLHSVTRDLFIYLKEKEFDNVSDMCKSAELFREARPTKNFARRDDVSLFSASVAQVKEPSGQSFPFRHPRGSFGAGRGSSRGAGRGQPSKTYSGQSNFSSFSSQSVSCPSPGKKVSFDKAGGSHRQSRDGSVQQKEDRYSRQRAKCFKCGGIGHYSSQCPSKEPCEKVLACRVLVSAEVAKHLGKLAIHAGFVNDQRVSVLRDSGCTTAGVRKSLVLPEQYTGDTQRCITFGGKVEIFPVARVIVCTPFFKGEINCCVIDDPVTDLILGNLHDVSDAPVPDLEHEVALVTTRLQEKREKELPKQLSTPLPPDLPVDREKLISLQKADPLLNECFQAAQSGETSKAGAATVSFCVSEGMLFRMYQDVHSTVKQIVVPQSLRASVLCAAHDSISAGHCGIKRTLKRVFLRFYWPGVTQSVRQYCRTCDVCQKTKAKGRLRPVPLAKMPVIDVPFKRIAVDLIGPFSPTSRNGYRWVLTVIDVATRFPEAIPLKSIDTVSVAEALMGIFSRVGYPEEIQSDKGTQFVSDLMQQIHRLLSIRSVSTSPYHPQSNGLVERFNGTLKTMLRKVVRTHPNQWDRYLPALLFAYRELPNASTGFSPFELLFGRRPRGPVDLLAHSWTQEDPQTDGKPLYHYVSELKQVLAECMETAVENVKQATDTHKQYFDRNTVDRRFQTGDEVLVFLPTEHNKLLMAWKGPYRVNKVLGTDYQVDVGKGKLKIFHANLLQKYFRRSETVLTAAVSTQVPKDGQGLMDDRLALQELPKDYPQEEFVSCVSVITDDDKDIVSVPTLPFLGKETVKDVQIDSNLTSDQKDDMISLLQDFPDVLTDAPGSETLGVVHEINLTTDQPVRLKPYPLPLTSRDVVEREVQSMLDLGVIEPSKSPYSSPIVLVTKKDGSVRFCIDFRRLNSITVFDAEPIPDVDELFCRLSGATYFTKVDLAKGYWQIPVREQDKEKTAFQTPFGLFQWTRMPFGLVTAPATFARMMRLLRLADHSALSFFDDILIASVEWSAHLKHVRGVLQSIRDAGLTARPSKLFAGFQELEFLGHVVSKGVLKPEESKVKKMLSFPRPVSKKQVRSLMGLLSYYRKFIPRFASLAAPLTSLTKGVARKPVVWTEECEQAFKQIQTYLSSFPVLRLPDLNLPFVVRTDASSSGVGAVLLQVVDGTLHPITYISRKLLEREMKYSTVERECLAIVWAIGKLSKYLWGKQFVLQTDHKPLTYLKMSNFRNARLTRWALSLQEYHFTVEPVSGTVNQIADALSRSEADQVIP